MRPPSDVKGPGVAAAHTTGERVDDGVDAALGDAVAVADFDTGLRDGVALVPGDGVEEPVAVADGDAPGTAAARKSGPDAADHAHRLMPAVQGDADDICAVTHEPSVDGDT